MRGAGPLGSEQRSFRRFGNNLRVGKRRGRRRIFGDPHGSAFRTRKSDGRQGPEPGLGGGEEAATVNDGRGGSRSLGGECGRDTLDEFVCPGDGEQRCKGKSRRGCPTYRTQLSEPDQTTARS